MLTQPLRVRLITQWQCTNPQCQRTREFPRGVMPQCCGKPMMRVGMLEEITPVKKHRQSNR